MTVTARLADGTELNFPDGTDPTVIQGTVKRVIAQRSSAASAVNNDQISQDAKAGPSFLTELRNQAGNLIAGGLRGAGSIGATLISASDKLNRATTPDAQQQFLGYSPASSNPADGNQLRQDMNWSLQDMGADTNSPAFKAGKVGAEIAGTSGAGAAIAKGLSAVPAIATAAPNLLQAIRTAGATAGNTGGIVNALTRATGGAINGGVSAGLVDPQQAVTGAAIGATLPIAVRAAGAAGNAIGNLVRGPAQTPEMANAIEQARAAGYVIPPTQANPSLLNRAIEGFSGKLTTAQNASARNAATTNRLAAEAIGLPGETVLTPAVLNDVRREAGQAYTALNGAGVITPGPQYNQALDAITQQARTAAAGFPNAPANPLIERIDALRSPQFDTSAAVAQTRELRDAADAAASSGDRGLSRSLRQASDALEDAIGEHLQQTGQTDLLANFQAARQRIAQTYSIQKALNAETGTVDAKKLAAQLQKDKPLSGGLEAAARFAARFPKAAQTPEVMGSLPGTSPLDFAAAGGMTAASGNPLAMASVLARPAARAMALSPVVQNRLAQAQGPNALQALIAANPELAALAYRAAPATLADR